MPPRRRTSALPPPLTDTDVTALRAKLNAGERPRVSVRAASAAVPAGTRGNVVRLGNPADGEFIVVRLGRDEVPFAPSELALTGRAGKAAAAAAPAPAATASGTGRRRAAVRTPKTESPSSPASAPSRTRAAASSAAVPRRTGTARQAGAARQTGAARKTGAGRRKTLPPLTVTLRFGDGAWTVEAQRGSRRVARASALRPGAVKAFADLVDEPAVREALTETVESCRAVVEERAAKLRAELDAAEETLKEYEARKR